ncbi:MAG: cyclic beta 1-2 glucan synthetase, partial [Cyclobacteriaceae bacterium]|nr:cyclic beta 1-2 glucan synthetase [Cyclobacteriaceae bacterium]
YRLTPWNNDPVIDASGEMYYIRDEESGQYWSPLRQLPHRPSTYVVKHGFGYSTFEHVENGIHSEACIYVDKEAPVKFISIKLTNQSGHSRKLSVTGYVEWVLGELRSKSTLHIVTEKNSSANTILASNPFNADFQSYVSFFDVDDTVHSFTTDRKEFIGRNGSLENPEAMNRTQLSGKTGAGMDACAALQVMVDFTDQKEYTIIFKLGAAKNRKEALEILQRFKGRKVMEESLSNIRQFWRSMLGKVQIKTPDASLNLLANGWLLYQVIVCRLWARSGFYQSGGAFGYRDQLQDVLALLHAAPSLTRKQILLHASRQFIEGDVQHWWHPPQGRGVRTLCSDDYLWLP